MLEFAVKTESPAAQRSACVIVGVFESQHLSESAAQIDQASSGYLTKLVKRGDFEGQIGQSLLLHEVPGVKAERVLLVGCGKEKDFANDSFRRAALAAVTALNGTGVTEAVSYLTALEVKDRDLHWKLRLSVDAACEAVYRFDEMKSKKSPPRHPFRKLALYVPAGTKPASVTPILEQGRAIAEGVKLTKDLGNLPSNICTPSYLAQRAQALQKAHKAIKVEVLDQKRMEAEGMGSLLAVARGSRQPPKLICLEYKGGKDKNAKPVALVGKGVTFDTGGISIKPAAAMDEMKYDMCGAASVLGTFQAIAQMGLPLNVVGLIPAVENMPGGDATRPGDIVKSMSGQTIEILNTDAEGRLILCDAMTYAKKYEPSVVIDIATLTGACVIALGKFATGLFSNHEPLAKDLLAAGEYTGDRAWQLPVWEDYQQLLESPFADFANIGGREGGAITAACFLARFARQYHWAHLDIAGTAWLTGKQKGATGRPVPLLVEYLLRKAHVAH
jgi:leucyl aminopeptidase